jgi:hypothetical protein
MTRPAQIRVALRSNARTMATTFQKFFDLNVDPFAPEGV